jgi:hypothetical protein
MQTKVEELEMYNSVEASTLRTGVQMELLDSQNELTNINITNRVGI